MLSTYIVLIIDKTDYLEMTVHSTKLTVRATKTTIY